MAAWSPARAFSTVAVRSGAGSRGIAMLRERWRIRWSEDGVDLRTNLLELLVDRRHPGQLVGSQHATNLDRRRYHLIVELLLERRLLRQQRREVRGGHAAR